MSPWYALVAHLPFDWAHYVFMQNALLAILLVSPLFALLGCLVVNNQMAFFSEAVGHATLTGLALGVVLGFGNPVWSMIGFSVLLALGVSALRQKTGVSPDTLIGLVMAFSVALGVVLLSRGGGFARYSGFLIGDLLTITPGEIGRLALLLALVVGVWLFFFNALLLTFLNRSLAKSRGFRAWALETFFATLVALVVAVTIPWVGLLVVNSLLLIPAATARTLAANTRQYVLASVLLSEIAGVTGLVLSFRWGTATGATVVLVAMALYGGALAVRR